MSIYKESTMYNTGKNNPSLLEPSLQFHEKTTIFFLWDIRSGAFQTNDLFEHFFDVMPKTFLDFKKLIFKEDLQKLGNALKENTAHNNTILALRMRTKDQLDTWFMLKCGQVGDNLLTGTLDLINLDDPQYTAGSNTLENKGQKTNGNTLENERKNIALELVKAGLWDWDVASEQVYYSSVYTSMIGYAPHEFTQNVHSWIDRVHPDDYEKTVERQLKYIENSEHGDSFACKYRFRNAEGRYIWIQSQGKVISRDAKGKGIRLVGFHIDTTEEEEAKEELEFMATRDVLTGLHNRNYFETQFAQVDESALPAAYILVDADGLKMINDCVNHTAGDLLLQRLAHTLRFAIRGSDLLARIGGDEFAIFLPRTEKHNAIKVAKKIYDTIASSHETDHGMVTCASLGLACASTAEELLTLALRADITMLSQKKEQRSESLKKTQAWIDSLVDQSCLAYKDKRIHIEND